MSLNTYANLQTAIGDWLADSNLSSYLADFITLGEARLARDLRIRQMETALSGTISSGVLSVPSAFLELKHARIVQSTSRPLEPKDAQWIYRKYPLRSSHGTPQFIGVDGSSFVFGPYPDSNYTVAGIYYAKPAVLSGTNTTNVWTDSTPDALLFACLIESAPFKGQDARMSVWQTKYDQIIDAYNRQQKRQARRGARVSYN